LEAPALPLAVETVTQIVERVKEIIREQFGVEKSKISPRASFVDDLGTDSLDTVELVMAIEEVFDIKIPDNDPEKMRTVQDLIDYIEKHSKKKK
jgi:acyl carrier protein